MQGGGTVQEKQQICNIVHLLLLEENSADSKIELPDTRVGFLEKRFSHIKFVIFHIISLVYLGK